MSSNLRHFLLTRKSKPPSFLAASTGAVPSPALFRRSWRRCPGLSNNFELNVRGNVIKSFGRINLVRSPWRWRWCWRQIAVCGPGQRSLGRIQLCRGHVGRCWTPSGVYREWAARCTRCRRALTERDRGEERNGAQVVGEGGGENGGRGVDREGEI